MTDGEPVHQTEFINNQEWEDYLRYEFELAAYLMSLLEETDDDENEETRNE